MLYVLVPVLVHVLLDGSGHDSAEIDGTVERHATSAPTKQPVPAPRHSTRSSIKTDFHLDFGDTTSCAQAYSPKRKTKEQSKPLRRDRSPEKSAAKSKIPVKVKKSVENETTTTTTTTTNETELRKTTTDSLATTQGSTDLPLAERTTDSEKLLQDLSERSLGEKEARQPEEDKEKSDSAKPEVSNETQTTIRAADTLDADLFEPAKRVEVTAKTVVTEAKEESETDSSSRPQKTKFDVRESESKVSKRSVVDETSRGGTTVMRTTVTTVRCSTTEPATDTEQTKRTIRTIATSASGDYGDVPVPVVKGRDVGLPFDVAGQQPSTKAAKNADETSEATWAHGSVTTTDRSFQNDEKLVGQWGEGQRSQDTSPGSGNGDVYAKNDSSRHDLNSDTESDGSPRSRRRSPSKRCTLDSSSGSDVALHEGAELSPLEDDQGTALTANLLSKQCTYPANRVTLRDSQIRGLCELCSVSLYASFLFFSFLVFLPVPCWLLRLHANPQTAPSV